MEKTNKVKEIIDIFFNEIFPKYELTLKDVNRIGYGIMSRAENNFYINFRKTDSAHSDNP